MRPAILMVGHDGRESVQEAISLLDGIETDILWVKDRGHLIDQLSLRNLALVIVDVPLRHEEERAMFSVLSAPASFREVPLLFLLQGVDDEHYPLACLTHTNVDTLVRPFHRDRFRHRVSCHLAAFQQRILIADQQRRLIETEADLETLQEVAKVSSQAKTLFLANMNHELRSPMNAVIGFSDLLLETPLDTRQREYMELILNAAESLMSLLTDILDYSKIEAGKLLLEEVPFVLSDVVSDACRKLSGVAEQKGLSMNWQLDETLPTMLKGDPDRLHQVIYNLLNNAVKFSARGKIQLDIKSISVPDGEEEVPPGTTLVHFQLRDQGVGISSEKVHAIFDSFTQGESGYTRNFSGSGLGLTIVKQLVRQMGGEIKVESEEGVGSTFRFTARFFSLPDAGEEESLPATQDQSPPRLRHVLLVEDDRVNQEVISEILTRYGHQVDIAGNGEDALIFLEKSSYDMILMDVQMPVMNGNETTYIIRQGGTRDRQIPIIGLSANVMKDNIQESLSMGMDDFLTKPCRSRTLLSMVDKADRFRSWHEKESEGLVKHGPLPVPSGGSMEEIFQRLEKAVAAEEGQEAIACIGRLRDWVDGMGHGRGDNALLRLEAMLQGKETERAVARLPQLRMWLESVQQDS